MYLFASLKNMNLMFFELKKLKMHGFNFLQARKAKKKKTNLIFYKFEKAKKEFNSFCEF